MNGRSDGERLREVAMEAQQQLAGRWWSYMIRGVLAGILGLCALLLPSTTIELLVTLVGIFCLVDGLTALLGIYKTSRRRMGMAAPIVSVGIGLVLLLWPDSSVRLLLAVFGVFLLIIGIAMFFGARQSNLQGIDQRFMSVVGGVTAVVGLVMVLWPGTGVVAISWLIAIPALLVSALLIILALRLKAVHDRSQGFEA